MTCGGVGVVDGLVDLLCGKWIYPILSKVHVLYCGNASSAENLPRADVSLAEVAERPVYLSVG